MSIFLIYEWLSDETPGANSIIIDDSHLAHLVSVWELQWNRPPTEEELESLLEKHVRQEVFYREALRMNLDHNDEIVKRRMAQKMEFLSGDLSAFANSPTDEALRAYYENHREKYKIPFQYSFK